MRYVLKAILVCALTLFVAPACSSSSVPYVWVNTLPPQPPPPDGNALRRGDVISVTVGGQQTLSGEFPVGSDGSYVHPLAGPVMVEGLKASQAAEATARKLQGKLVNPQVTVIVLSRNIEITVIGEVSAPGVYPVKPQTNVLQVLARAGGITEFADRDSIYVLGSQLKTRVRVKYDDLVTGNPRSLAFAVRDGDIVVVE